MNQLDADVSGQFSSVRQRARMSKRERARERELERERERRRRVSPDNRILYNFSSRAH